MVELGKNRHGNGTLWHCGMVLMCCTWRWHDVSPTNEVTRRLSGASHRAWALPNLVECHSAVLIVLGTVTCNLNHSTFEHHLTPFNVIEFHVNVHQSWPLCSVSRKATDRVMIWDPPVGSRYLGRGFERYAGIPQTAKPRWLWTSASWLKDQIHCSVVWFVGLLNFRILLKWN